MKRLPILVTALIALSLSACGSKGEGGNNSTAPTAKLAAVAPPAGKKWTDVVSETADHGFVMGNPDAPIKVIEFGSFTCPHCRDFSAESAAERNAMVDTGKLSFEYRTFLRDPLDVAAALIARCSGPEPFFPLTEQVFANQNDMITKMQAGGDAAMAAASTKPMNERFFAIAQLAGLIDFGKQRGISEEKAKQCLTNTKTVDALVEQVKIDTAKYNIQGTPTLVMNSAVVENAASWDVMRAKLKEAGL